MREEIDMTTYPKRNQYKWFMNYPSSAYGFDVDMDVTEIVRMSKERKESFFPYFFYAIMKGINSVKELRMRVVDGKPYLYSTINPTFTVMTVEGVYQNCGFEMVDDFSLFYKTCKENINVVKNLPTTDELDRYPICQTPNVVFGTCIPVLNYTAMTHPLPTGNQESLSIPRVCFGKYHQVQNESYHVTLNITVSHVFVDGYPLAACFDRIQKECSACRNWLK